MFPAYLAIKKGRLETRAGFMLAFFVQDSLKQPFVHLISVSSGNAAVKVACRTLWDPALLLCLSLFSFQREAVGPFQRALPGLACASRYHSAH